MKKIISLSLLIIIIAGIFFAGCGKVEAEQVILSDEKVTVQLKDTYELTAKVKPDDAAEPMVYWESSDSSVVTVKSGVVSAVGEGNATVKAFTVNGVYDECEFTVENIQVKKLILNKKKFTMMVGAQDKLQCSVIPQKVTNSTIEWESSDTSVATVNNGIVKAKNVGNCNITATSANGVSATAKLTVKVKPAGVSLSAESATVGTGKTLKLSAKILPDDTAYKEIKWESSNENIAVVDNKGKVTGVKVGRCKIYATTYNNKYDYCDLTVTQSPLKFSGTGNKTLENVTVSEGVYAITLTHNGTGIFQVIGSDGDERAYTYIDTVGNYKGTNLYAKGKSDGVENATIKIAATGDWTLKIKAVTYDGTDNISGSGDCVSPMFKGTNAKETVKLKNKGNGDFTVFLFDQSGKQVGVLCDEIDEYEGNVFATLDKNKYYFIITKSGGNWTVDFGNGSKKTTVKNTN